MQKDFNSSSTTPPETAPGPLALYKAAMYGEYGRVKALLDNGYKDINERHSNLEESALHCLAADGETVLVAQLITLGADVSAKDYRGAEPLHRAAYRDNVVVARQFLEAGADIDAKTDGGQTPLHLAALNGKAGMVEYLVEQGADLFIRDNGGLTASDLAKHNGYDNIAGCLEGDMFAQSQKMEREAKAALEGAKPARKMQRFGL